MILTKRTFIALFLPLISILSLIPIVMYAQDASTTDETSSSTVTTATSSEPAVTDSVPTPLPPAGGSAPLSPTAQNRLTNLAANVSNALDGYVLRLENVTTRLASRISKEEAAGKNLTVAKTALDTAVRELATAKAELATIDTEVSRFIGSENPRQAWATVRSVYQTAYTAINASHTATLQAVRAVRQGDLIIPPEAASETSTSTEEDTL